MRCAIHTDANILKQIHPTIDRPEVTIVSDQDKGSRVAVREVLPNAHHFHCSWHRRQNITKAFGNKDGKVEGTANWMFNLLSNCKTRREINMQSEKHLPSLSADEQRFLLKLADNAQYPAARCAMGPNVYMYGRTASSGVESMNRANMEVRNNTSVDALNAAMTLIRIESRRYEKYKESAWKHDLPLTPKGMMEMRAVFDNVVPSQYKRHVEDMNTYYRCTVSRNSGEGVLYTVAIPKIANHGSFFGGCNCGVPKRDGVPCVHMAVLADAGDIPIQDFSRVSLMPFWLSTTHWRKQYPENVSCNGTVNIRLVMSKYNPEDNIRYCPDWLAPKKAGRPKKNHRELGVSDHVESGAKKRKKKMFCKLCHKFNHDTIDCYRNPNNARNDQGIPEHDDGQPFGSGEGGGRDGDTGVV